MLALIIRSYGKPWPCGFRSILDLNSSARMGIFPLTAYFASRVDPFKSAVVRGGAGLNPESNLLAMSAREQRLIELMVDMVTDMEIYPDEFFALL